MNGKLTSEIPYSIQDAPIKPNYRTFKGWSEDLTGIRNYNDLPENFRLYIDYVSQQVGQKMSVISVGPDREQTILI
jgi:adenylosuccinate synthase